MPSIPARLADEQASLRLQQQDFRDLLRALQDSENKYDIEDTSDEDLSIVEHSVEEIKKEKVRTSQIQLTWTTKSRRVQLPNFSSCFGSFTILKDPLSLFQLFITPSLLDLIAKNTTAYAHYKGASDNWCTTMEELQSFIAVHICMGICRYPQVAMYWSQENRHPWISECMTRDRFKELLRYFHISHPHDVSSIAQPLGKIRPLLDSLASSFPSWCRPGQEMTVDEAMVGFKGRSVIKQYIPLKPTKWGYKIWCLTSLNYLFAFEIFEGTKRLRSENSPEDALLRLVRPYFNRHHIVFMDRLFTSPSLLSTLLENGTYGCGTVRKDRVGLSAEFKHAGNDMKKGTIKTWQAGKMGALVWRDRKVVHMLSTHISPTKTQRILRQEEKKKTIVPSMVLDYNKFKGGVDTVDQMHENYSIGRKSMKWWPRLVWWCIDLCIHNAYILHCMNSINPMTNLQFREHLMHQLLEKYGQPCRDRGRKRQRSQDSNENQHWPIHVSKKSRCWYCNHKKNIRTDTHIKCKVCDKYLCVDPCFELYHTTCADE